MKSWKEFKSNLEEKKLDPVGQEDADIDNDGDVDKSDKYLGKRRKAIAKAMKKRMKKEEVEQVIEGDGDPCWDTHKQVGMKKKGNRMVPNCVPKNEEVELDERTRFAKETGKDYKTGNPSEKGGTRTGKTPFDKVSREMRKTGGVMSSRGKGIQPQGKKKEKGAKGYKGVTPVDKIRNRLAQKRAAKPNPYRARAGESD